MAAPSGTKWGSIVGGYGRIGIYVSVSNVSSTQSKRHTEIWFWSKYSVHDSNNTFYYNDQSTSATTSRGSVSVNTSVDSGGGWSTSNQQKIYTADYTFNRGTSNSTKSVAVKLSGIERVGGTMYCTHSYTIPAKPSYTVTFVNGYGGTIKTQTVYHGGNASAPANPTRTGYTFAGWSGTYTNVTSSRTITATWSIWKYTIAYNANGGSGAPGSQTKNYGSNITLSSTRPTRANYNFLGWATSASGGVAYNPGSTYSANANVTLYAVWQLAYQKPRISGFSVQRCNSSGTVSESGTCGKVSFNWATDRAVTAVYVQWRAQNSSSWSSLSIGGASTTVSNKVFGDNGLSAETSYIVRVYVSDNGGTTYSSELSLGTIKYPIDVKAGGTGVAFGKVAERTGYVDFGWPIYCYDNTGKTCISRRGVSNTWINGRNSAMIKMHSVDGYSCMASLKTVNGTWDIGTYSSYVDKLAFTYITDANYNSGNNTLTGQVIFNTDGSIDARVSKATYADSAGSASSASNASWASYANNLSGGDVRTVGDWIGIYSGSSRRMWMGMNGSSNFNIYNEAGGNIYVNSQVQLPNARYVWGANTSGSMYPLCGLGSSNTFYLADNAYRTALRGSSVYLGTGGATVTSDRNLKHDIKSINDKYEMFFNLLAPISFKYTLGRSGRDHIGFIAQDVERALYDSGLTTYEFAGICKEELLGYTDQRDGTSCEDYLLDRNINEMYTLRYEEFIGLNTLMIQKLLKRVDCLEKQIKLGGN